MTPETPQGLQGSPDAVRLPTSVPSTTAVTGATAYVWTIASIAALGGLLFGYDWVVIGGAKPFYEAHFKLTSASLIGWVNSCALLGCLLGTILCGAVSRHLGRKWLLIFSALLFAASSVLTGWAHSLHKFVIWRIVGGMAIGIASNVSPIYIAEVSPPLWRGRLVALNQLAIVIGIFAAQVVNWLIAEPVPTGADAALIRASWNGEVGWRWMFTAVALPSTVFFVSALFIPESPRWLITRGKLDRAREILQRIGDTSYTGQVVGDSATEHTGPRPRTIAELLSRPLLGTLLVGIFLAFLQQWCGINVIFYYAEEIYAKAGYDLNAILFNIILTGAVNVGCTILALRWIDGLGRRALMLFGCAAISLCHLLLGVFFALNTTGPAVLIVSLFTIGCFAVSLAPVTWVLIAEMFPNEARGEAVSISVAALWISCFLATLTFPVMVRGLGASWTFWIYGLVCLAGFAVVKTCVRETKGRSLEEIERDVAGV